MDSALKKDENYCPQVFLKEVKYINKVVIRHINDYLSDFFIILMSLMKNKLKLILFLKSYDIISQTGNAHTQKACCIFKTLLAMH